MNELSVLLSIVILLVIATALLIMYGNENHKVLWGSFFIYVFCSYLTIYVY
jgi:hypothetical protein